LITAVVIWILVSHSITATRTLPNVPVRVVQLPPEKTVEGLLPDGTLNRRVTLTLHGAKATIDNLDPADVEVVLDASGKGDEWVANISKKNLVSLNPEIDLLHDITSVLHTEIVIKLHRLVTAKIPVYIAKPRGEAPQGYQFLGTWPPRLTHTLSGPEHQLRLLQSQGLELRFNLDEVRRSDLDELETAALQGHEGEVHFIVPAAWKRVAIPFLDNALEPINDPEAKHLRLEFLRNEWLSLESPLPVSVFYPTESSDRVNPDTYALAVEGPIGTVHGIPFLQVPVYVTNVSRVFLELVQDHMVLTIVAAPKSHRREMEWTVQVVAPDTLEDLYVELMLGPEADTRSQDAEEHARRRFRTYLRNLALYEAPERPLNLSINLRGAAIRVDAPTADWRSDEALPQETVPAS
jgi:hypothetical protein